MSICPKCDNGCTACFKAGLSHGEALAARIAEALDFHQTHWHDYTREHRFVGEVRDALKTWKPE